LYAGIEHRQTDEVYQCLKLISRPGSEKIVRYAFEYAKRNNRKKVTCFTKDNIMKFTDGLFHKVFDEIGTEYPDFDKEHWIVDIGAAKLADTPEAFDVIVMPNLYGDILSDVSAQIAGSVGLAGSANIGEGAAMFEAIHGSAPRRAGQNLANPSGLLHGGLLMLVHIGQPEVAERIHNAWLKTIEDGVHTYDIYKEGTSKRKVGTKEFAEAVVERLGEKPAKLKEASYSKSPNQSGGSAYVPKPRANKQLIGVDVFFQWNDRNAEAFGKKLEGFNGEGLKFTSLSNRGVKVYPEGFSETFCTDHWRAGYMSEQGGGPVTHGQIVGLLSRLEKAGLDFIKIENLYTFDGQKGFVASQGE
jgi:isocitrate dehydrogenase